MGRYKGLGMPKAKKKRVKAVDFAKIVKEVEPPLAGGEGGAASTRKLREPPAAPSSAPPSPAHVFCAGDVFCISVTTTTTNFREELHAVHAASYAVS